MIATSRGDRLIIDDPHPTATKEEQAAAMARFRESVRARLSADLPAIIIMAKLHNGGEA